ncbi:MAG: phosphodiester glycosidase family protein [Lentisphaeria bacterium]|nr:phosphodiester glycosidase family protein [Lentisphaeria bacterium]NQZ70369.1 phosphodiester glycosidase family protein [Lentisphaeria bacterium]
MYYIIFFLCLLNLYSDELVVKVKSFEHVKSSKAKIVYWHEVRTKPRPLQLHTIRIDLKGATLKFNALISKDPDGKGPAEAQLSMPWTFHKSKKILATINCNAFGAQERKDQWMRWYQGQAVTILGWAKNKERLASKIDGNASFWIGPKGIPHCGKATKESDAQIAISGFREILKAGTVVTRKKDSLHPRTVVGISKDKCYVFFSVIDGRRKDSKGVTTMEHAEILKAFGAWDAINLDGGGSSIMYANSGSGLIRMNKPSSTFNRPVPVMLAIERK